VYALRNNLRIWGTSREHDENMLGTHWKKRRQNKKKSCPHPQKAKTGLIMSAC
jgi:hypothetical protein